MRHSDMFEAYSQLLEEKGLVKTAAEEEKESKELKKYKSEAYARVGSDSISTIEALYGVKPECIPEMEYEFNIAEVAHPKAVVVAPSYDKINGLVENINEQHNIIRNKIMSKAPSGNPFLLKDAEQMLTKELIRIGNDMDNFEEIGIRDLADECIEDLRKQAGWWDDTKDFLSEKVVKPMFGGAGEKAVGDVGSLGKGIAEGAAAGALIAGLAAAWFPPAEAIAIPGGTLTGAIIGGALGGGTLGALSSWLFNTGSKVRNIKENSKSFLEQLKDLEKAIPEQIIFFDSLKKLVNDIVVASDKYMEIVEKIRQEETESVAITQQEIDSAKNTSENFVKLINKFNKVHKDFIEKAKRGDFAKALNWMPGLDDDIQDVENEFLSLGASISNLKDTMGKWSGKVVDEATKALEQQQNQKKENNQVSQEQKVNIEDEPVSDKFFSLIGHKPSKDELEFLKMLGVK